MEYKEAKQTFIQAWGTLGSSWGINKAMAQIHALLLLSKDPLSTEQIMEELKMSRGNVNMNVRALIDWTIVKKVLIPGERKEYFETGKDVNELAKIIVRERRKRELEPVREVLSQLQAVGVDKNNEDIKVFKQVTSDLKELTDTAENAMKKFEKTDFNWFYKALLKL